MPDIHEVIDVAATPQDAYAVWADFEAMGRFVSGVETVQRTGENLHWVVKLGPKTQEWDATVVADEPGRRLAWQAPDGPIDTDITFEPLDAGGTRVTFQERMHDSLPAQLAAKTPFADRQARQDLERYKDLVEGR